MIDGLSVLGIIPARGGSKGIPGKNIRNLAGKPLIAWTIEEASKSRYLDRVILSSEDDGIIQVARRWGCEVPFVRPAELSSDDTPGVEPVLHAIRTLPGYHYVVLLQPTSPLRTVADIDGCIELCARSRANSCVSVCEPDKSPFWMFTIDADGMMHKLLEMDFASRRQDLPEVFVLNGAVYVAPSAVLLEHGTFLAHKTISYVMSKENSVDIDTELDIVLAEALIGKMRSGSAE